MSDYQHVLVLGFRMHVAISPECRKIQKDGGEELGTPPVVSTTEGNKSVHYFILFPCFALVYMK